jgi:hypothetical protein
MYKSINGSTIIFNGFSICWDLKENEIISEKELENYVKACKQAGKIFAAIIKAVKENEETKIISIIEI